MLILIPLLFSQGVDRVTLYWSPVWKGRGGSQCARCAVRRYVQDRVGFGCDGSPKGPGSFRRQSLPPRRVKKVHSPEWYFKTNRCVFLGRDP